MTLTLKEAQTIAHDLMVKHGLAQDGWTLRLDGAKVRVGYCQYSEKLISISRNHILTDDPKEVIDTITHEIAHALVGGEVKPHGPEWKAKHKELGGSGLVRMPRPEIDYTLHKGQSVVIDLPRRPLVHGTRGVVTKVKRVNVDVLLDNGKEVTGSIAVFKPLDKFEQAG